MAAGQLDTGSPGCMMEPAVGNRADWVLGQTGTVGTAVEETFAGSSAEGPAEAFVVAQAWPVTVPTAGLALLPAHTAIAVAAAGHWLWAFGWHTASAD